MNDYDLDDRTSALDAFAAPVAPPSDNLPVAVQFQSPDRIFGAQKVAVQRDDAKVLQKLSQLGAAAGEDWYYRFPVKNRRENRTDWIEGPSIKLANDLARMYGNCDVDTRVIDAGDHWIFYARFLDIETGFSMTRSFQQRKNQGSIKGDADRSRDIAFQIGQSKAIRNVVVNALQTYADYAFKAAKNSLIEKIGKNIEGWRDRIAERLAERLDVKRVEKVIGRAASEWLAPDIARIIAMVKAVDDGMATLNETFPPLDVDGKEIDQADDKPASKPNTDNLNQFAQQKSDAGQESSVRASEAGAAAASPQPSSQTAPAPAADDSDFPGDKPAQKAQPEKISPVELARTRGAQAFRENFSRRALPPEYREDGRADEKAAWLAGYDQAQNAAQ